jgi:hypothetical protein
LADSEDDGDRRGCSFGGERGHGISGRGDHSHLSANQIGHQRRQAVVVAFHPMVLNGYVLPVDVAGFTEALIESGRIARIGVR